MTNKNSLTLHWTLQGPGAARLSWCMEDDTVVIYTSYLGNALDSLIRAALDLNLGSSASIAVFLGEPGGHRIFFSGAAEEVYVQIVKFDDLFTVENRWKGGELRWERRISTSSFIRAVREMTEQIFQEYGQVGYAKAWGSPFPEKLFTALKRIK